MAPIIIAAALGLLGCPDSGPAKPLHRERATERDSACIEPTRPHAYFYPAKDRTNYGPDRPDQDGCQLLVPDHLFCCPNSPRGTDR